MIDCFHLFQVNGSRTLGENIADNGGVKVAYYAYNKWEKQNGVEPGLPGLNYTSQQMFWISAANLWCSKLTPNQLKSTVMYSEHSPRQYRANGPLSNVPEFSKDFNCPKNSQMNSPNKCVVW